MLWRIVELACGVTWRLSRRNHQKYKPQMEQRPAGGHDVIECEDCRETITWCSRCVEEYAPCRKAESIQWVSPFFSPPILHLFVVVHESFNQNKETGFYHGLPTSRFTTVCTRWWAWMFIVLSSVKRALNIDCRALFSFLTRAYFSMILCVPWTPW